VCVAETLTPFCWCDSLATSWTFVALCSRSLTTAALVLTLPDTYFQQPLASAATNASRCETVPCLPAYAYHTTYYHPSGHSSSALSPPARRATARAHAFHLRLCLPATPPLPFLLSTPSADNAFKVATARSNAAVRLRSDMTRTAGFLHLASRQVARANCFSAHLDADAGIRTALLVAFTPSWFPARLGQISFFPAG